MVGSLHTEHGFVLVCKTYYSEIQSWFVAQGFSLFDLMISGLFPDDPTMFASVAERTITKHFRCSMTSLEMSMNSMATMFSWTKGMLRSTKLDNDSRLVDFARMIEKAVAKLFLSRYMTKDIEMCFEGLGTVRKRDYLNTLLSIANVVLTLSASLLIATPFPASCLFFGSDADTVPAFPDNSVRAIIEASSLPFTSAHKCTDSTATPGPKDYLRLRKSFPAFSGHGSSHCESMANMLIFFAPQRVRNALCGWCWLGTA
ncbi:hypothetical protein HPB51_026357 [Rhipicephalus microplus]|uniref:Uncharacterized protein n=1 Tax=Rhipicephalus microplus TaxID=6941 RepID=A0A9J6D385_RHIMP|nr:hypothetical protein HPB51_026357 [Rhipicephalus microplus]